MNYRYNNGRHCGGRIPRLYLAKGSEVRKFTGENIPGFAAIATEVYEKAGKFSNTDYLLVLAPGVRPLYFLSPLHGVWGDDFASWGEVAQALGLPVEVAQKIVRAEYGQTAERLDKLEAFAAEVEAQGTTTEIVVVSFGAPTNREIREGYWAKPKTAQTSDGRTVVVEPDPGSYGPDWGKARAVAPEGAKVLDCRHRPGMHGGYWAIEVAVPILLQSGEADK
jgi:hypothetical protein